MKHRLLLLVALAVTGAGCSSRSSDCASNLSCAGVERSDSGVGGSAPNSARSGGASTGGKSANGSNSGGASVGGASLGGANAGGTSAGASTGGLGTGGTTSACTPACSGTTPFCDESTKTCVECLTGTQCGGAKRACSSASHQCVECTTDDNCSQPKPGCDTSKNVCVPCTQNTHCLSMAATPICDTSKNVCVQCTQKSECSGTTPFCDTSKNTCVQCTKTTDCSGATPEGNALLCDTSKNLCVECLTQSDCKSAAASACIAGDCTPCTTNAECSNIAGKGVCKTTAASSSDADAGAGTGTCVQCTGTQYSACGQSAGNNLVCDTLNNTCSTAVEQSAGLCKTCVSDAQCRAGEMCVNQTFGGKSVGYFCFYKQGDTANLAPADCTLTGRPYVKVDKNAVSIDGQTADICSLVTSTCTALNQFRSTTCTSATSTTATPDDQLCGVSPGIDSKCIAYGTSQYRCTVTCLGDDDCPKGVNVACDTGVNPPVCTF